MKLDSQSELNKKAKKIDDIYQFYLNNLEKLQQKQQKLISDFIKMIEAEKIKQITKSLNSK